MSDNVHCWTQTSAKTGEGVKDVSINVCSFLKILPTLSMRVIMRIKTSRKWSIPKKILFYWRVQFWEREKLEKRPVALDSLHVYQNQIKNLIKLIHNVSETNIDNFKRLLNHQIVICWLNSSLLFTFFHKTLLLFLLSPILSFPYPPTSFSIFITS